MHFNSMIDDSKFNDFSEYSGNIMIDCSMFTLSAINDPDENKVDNEWMHKILRIFDKTSKSNESNCIYGAAMFG
jgi:hypothetical protein